MNPYQPKLSHVIFTSLLSASFAYLWANTLDRVSTVMLYAAGLFLAITIILVWLVGESSHYWSVTKYLEALVKIDSDLRNALALNVPSLHLIATRGHIKEVIDWTDISKEHWLLFLQDSTREHTASKRDWKTSERPAWAWQGIFEYLKEKKYISPYATGPDSYPWIGSAYMNLMVYWLGRRDVPNLNAEPRIYANEDD